MEQLTAYGIALVPVIIGLSELLKRFCLPNRFIPLAALAMGLFFLFFTWHRMTPKKAISSERYSDYRQSGFFQERKIPS